jgi:hypothetical protein
MTVSGDTGVAVEDPALDPLVGADLLTDLGFLRVPGAPLDQPPAYLFVALRPRPTLRHFDPERVDYWVSAQGRGVRASIDRYVPAGHDTSFAWGAIGVVDRKGVSNQYVAFGGLLRTRRIGDVMVAVFSSEAPIAARGGHSQGWDPLAGEMAAFLARLRATAGASRDFERALCAADPLSLYSTFVADSLARQVGPHGEILGEGESMELLRRERDRLSDKEARNWAAGQSLAAQFARLS